MRKKLKSLSFSKVSEGTLGTFLGCLCYFLGTKFGCVLLLRMRHKAMQLVFGRFAGHKMWANMRKKLKSLNFSRVSEGTLGTFLWFLCYVLGTKLICVLLLRMCHKAMQLVLGRLAGRKMWQTCALVRFQEGR